MKLFDASCYIGRLTTERLAFDDVPGLLTQMDRLSTALAALPDHSSHAALDLDSSLDELKRLADRVKRYNST